MSHVGKALQRNDSDVFENAGYCIWVDHSMTGALYAPTLEHMEDRLDEIDLPIVTDVDDAEPFVCVRPSARHLGQKSRMAIISTFATPPILYRYRPISDGRLERELSAVEQGHVYCPSIAAMNDPMEGSHRTSVLFSSDKRKRAVYKEILETREALGIASFSEVHDHEPMWAHYADQFRGICIGYSFRRLMEHLDKEYVFVRMNYSEVTPILRWSAGSVNDDARLTVSAKTVRWASEREWRLISPTQGPAPYDELKCVTRVYVGSRLEQGVLDEIFRRMHAIDVPVYKMSVDNYAINFTRYKAPGAPRRPRRQSGL